MQNNYVRKSSKKVIKNATINFASASWLRNVCFVVNHFYLPWELIQVSNVGYTLTLQEFLNNSYALMLAYANATGGNIENMKFTNIGGGDDNTSDARRSLSSGISADLETIVESLDDRDSMSANVEGEGFADSLAAKSSESTGIVIEVTEIAVKVRN